MKTKTETRYFVYGDTTKPVMRVIHKKNCTNFEDAKDVAKTYPFYEIVKRKTKYEITKRPKTNKILERDESVVDSRYEISSDKREKLRKQHGW